MNVIRLTATADADGKLRLELPVGVGEFEVAVVLSPKASVNGTAAVGTPETRGWPPGYFENTYGSITDETFVAPPRGPVRPVETIERNIFSIPTRASYTCVARTHLSDIGLPPKQPATLFCVPSPPPNSMSVPRKARTR
jgi:hypothetical protein